MSESSSSADNTGDSAYLLGWDGHSWRDMLRVSADQVTTIGRAPTNRVVLRDEICSRTHCEIFRGGQGWRLKDLDSRNGTLLDGEDVNGEVPLAPGQIIEIGDCTLTFTDDLARPLPWASSDTGLGEETRLPESVPLESHTEILERRDRNRFRAHKGGPDRTSQELARLYRLGFELGGARSRQALADMVLSSLAAETSAEVCAVLLVPEGRESTPRAADLQVIGYTAGSDAAYHRVSDPLCEALIRDREAILATEATEDVLAVFDSQGQLSAMSVICAPIKHEQKLHGLIHLYTVNPDNRLQEDDLDITVAVAEQLALALDHQKEKESLQSGLAMYRSQNQSLRAQLEVASEIIGESPLINDLRKKIGLIAPTGATVLIRGESGVGKELVARSIHFHSDRAAETLVCLNCAALNESLLESELFGHEKGAFTGATDRKVGRFEQAHKGTLFLDEIGEMTPAIQAKFLRVLEGQPFERLGGRKTIQVDVRVVAATNRDLEAAVEEGEFRRDLYFRLNVAEISVQPLRERREDIPLLADFFLKKFAAKIGRPISGFTPDALQMLRDYDWPGNVRELQNTIERTVILCGGELVCVSDIQLSRLRPSEESRPAAVQPQSWEAVSLADLEREHILATLDHTEWNKSRASQLLGIERSTLDRKLKRYQVSRPTGRDDSGGSS